MLLPTERKLAATALFKNASQWSTERGLLGLGVLILACVVVGYATATFVTLFASSPLKLLAFPAALVLLMLFALNPLKFFLGVLALRAIGDPIFDLVKLGNTGLGGLLNFMMIGLAMVVTVRDGARVSRPHALLWLFVLGGIVFATVMSPIPSEALRLLVGMFSNFAVFVVAFHVKPRGELALKFGASLVVWSSVLPSLYGLYVAVIRPGSRLASTFSHPNIYAFYIVLVLSLLLYILKSADWQLKLGQRRWLWAYFIIQSVLLGLTQTRSAWAGYLVVIGVYALLYERKWLLYLIVLPFIAMLVPSIRDRILDLGEGNEVVQYAKLNSFAWRVALWESAFDYMTLKGYFFGYGLESFRQLSATFFSLSGGMMWGSHSVYVQYIFEMGVLGCIPPALLYFKVFGDVARTLRRERIAGFVILAAVIQYLVTSASDNMLYYLNYNWYYWFILGCAAADTLAQVQRE